MQSPGSTKQNGYYQIIYGKPETMLADQHTPSPKEVYNGKINQRIKHL